MKVFLSHARKDTDLARRLTEQLGRSGFVVWGYEEHVEPGDNWAKKVGKALQDSDWMVFLLTPRAMDSDAIRRDVEFALGAKKFAHRVFTVFVGPTLEAGKDMPWILLKLPHVMVESAADFGKAVKELQTLNADADADVSHSNA